MRGSDPAAIDPPVGSWGGSRVFGILLSSGLFATWTVGLPPVLRPCTELVLQLLLSVSLASTTKAA